uniref:Uncharacterized protein n=1 Tax=Odontella aurita TaxID=265563 RepID=A0A7S4IV20_9STRA|mmetsp:Transcript_30712/g.91975  ORF Transcript_30712/g.91975 Transcript_30712/m.91975 type:complete len:149 (+) Transcript_30712:652-1098(+)
MAEEKVKVEKAAAHGVAAAGSAVPQSWRYRHKLRAAVQAKATRAVPASAMFNGKCDGLKGRALVFDSLDTRADQFTHIRREIAEHSSTVYGADVAWSLWNEKLKLRAMLTALGSNATDLKKDVCRVEISEFVNRIRPNGSHMGHLGKC